MKMKLLLLEKVRGLLEENHSRIQKEYILKAYPECKEFWYYIYNPHILFYVTGENIFKYMQEDNSIPSTEYENNLFKLLDDLNNRVITGETALYYCASFILLHREFQDLLIRIFDRDLNCGVSIKTINKIFPGLIPDFRSKVPLAKEYEEEKCNFLTESWYLSRKIDGVRCLAFVLRNDVILYSRNGIPFETLSVVRQDIQKHWKGSDQVVLDGEIGKLVPGTEEETFSGLMHEIRRKDHTIQNPVFYIFDMYPVQEFLHSTETNFDYSLRMSIVREQNIPDQCSLKLLPQEPIVNHEWFSKKLETIPVSWEGFILRKDGPTIFKRSNNLLKFKKFQDDEYFVHSIEIGRKTIDGVEQDCCGSLIIHHKGEMVSVGSGISDWQRIEWFKDPSKIVGKSITVKYFSESYDKLGRVSLRFPILKTVWEREKE